MTSAPTPTGPVLPDFDGRCLTNLLAATAASMGVPGHDDLIGLPERRRWVVLLVDGLGWHNLRSEPQLAPYLTAAAATSQPATSSAPSTTTRSTSSTTMLYTSRVGRWLFRQGLARASWDLLWTCCGGDYLTTSLSPTSSVH